MKKIICAACMVCIAFMSGCGSSHINYNYAQICGETYAIRSYEYSNGFCTVRTLDGRIVTGAEESTVLFYQPE